MYWLLNLDQPFFIHKLGGLFGPPDKYFLVTNFQKLHYLIMKAKTII
ncbi:hypothetical protein FDUTEX481_07114 [Tolypothrix sp. PCC 7601]|nr:hypothetical protein FDUTEX481_07114 [Tolypothrix sp. PCC 7601]